MSHSDRQPVSVPHYRTFGTTCWSVVISAGRNSSPDSKQALESLCKTYWPPLYAYVRRRVPDVHEAHDLTQAFFAELLEKNYVGTATPERGRFRAYLLTAFKHFLSKEWEKAKTQKRGGGRSPLSLDFDDADSNYGIVPQTNLTAEQLYERQWTMTLLAQVMQRLQDEFAQSDKRQQFEELKGFVIGDHSENSYAEVALRLNMTETAARMSASRMRKRYREILRDEIAQTVSNPDEIDDEIRNLFETLI